METAIGIVDDCVDLRNLAACILEGALGCRCLALGGLSEVVAHEAEVLATDAMLLDLDLGPEEPDGISVLYWLRERHYAGQVLFLTGHDAFSARAKRAALTGAPVAEKPASPSALAGLVRELLGHGEDQAFSPARREASSSA